MAAKEHVLEVECKIRLIKEQGRGIIHTLPFKKMPRIMLIELIYHVVLWLNAFPAKSGVYEKLSPHKIVYQHKLDFVKHCKLPFRTYCKVHEEPMPTNTLATCSTTQYYSAPQETCKKLTSSSVWRPVIKSSNASLHRIPCRTWSSRR